MKNAVVVMIAILIAPALAHAVDVVELKTGQRVEGSFKGADDVAVRITVNGRIVTFKPREVHAIYYDVERPVTSPVSPAQEVLKVLRDLQLFTMTKPDFSEYRGRLGYAKFRVGVLSGKLTDPPVNATTSAAVRFFDVANEAWTAMMRPPARERADDIRAIIRKSGSDCPALERLLSASADEVIDRVVPASWSCASEKVAELERLLKQS